MLLGFSSGAFNSTLWKPPPRTWDGWDREWPSSGLLELAPKALRTHVKFSGNYKAALNPLVAWNQHGEHTYTTETGTHFRSAYLTLPSCCSRLLAHSCTGSASSPSLSASLALPVPSFSLWGANDVPRENWAEENIVSQENLNTKIFTVHVST